MRDKNKLIFTIIWGIFLIFAGIVFIAIGIIQKSKVVYFGIIWIAVFGGLYTYKIIVAARQLKSSYGSAVANIITKEEEDVKENLANYAFDNLMSEGEDYTVVAKVPGAKLVKKTVRWAYFMRVGQGIQAIFSIETDKGLACFQMNDKKLMRIQPDIITELYPMLKP